MKCKFDHEGDCCNSGSAQYMARCKPNKCNCPVPITNYDSIKSKSVDEMVEFIASILGVRETGWIKRANTETINFIMGDKIKQWLLQEVSEK